MKNFIEKVKTNKLRSGLIGLSVFLFGFIAVNVFNNVGDTYAANPACYVCGNSQSGSYVWGDYSKSSSCAKVSNSYCSKPAQCYACGNSQSGSYVWGDYSKSSSCNPVPYSKTNCLRGAACYACGNSQSGSYVWGFYADNSSCAYQSDITTSSACTAKNIKTMSATFNATNGGTLSGSTTASCNTTESSPNSCKVTGPSATKSGYYLQGWSTSQSCSSYRSVNSDGTITLTASFNGNLYTCWGTEPPNNGNYNSTIDDDATVAYTRPIYTITYDLNGGKFIDGTTSRVSYIPSDKAIGDPKTNPIKDGMKFKEWQLDGSKFDFSQKPTQNITLKAVYEELTEEDKLYYCESDSDVLEVSTKTCYNVMKLDESKKLYNYTLYSYAAGGTFCYAYDATNNTSGGVYFRTDVSDYETITGKNNVDYSSFGYPEKEAWVSKDTCLIATECTEDASVDRPACEIRWDAIIYSITSVSSKEEEFEEDGTDVPIDDEPIDPDTPSDGEKDDNDKDISDKDDTDKDVSDSPKTGDALILIAWVVGIGAIGYTVYYFRKRKEN